MTVCVYPTTTIYFIPLLYSSLNFDKNLSQWVLSAFRYTAFKVVSLGHKCDFFRKSNNKEKTDQNMYIMNERKR